MSLVGYCPWRCKASDMTEQLTTARCFWSLIQALCCSFLLFLKMFQELFTITPPPASGKINTTLDIILTGKKTKMHNDLLERATFASGPRSLPFAHSAGCPAPTCPATLHVSSHVLGADDVRGESLPQRMVEPSVARGQCQHEK